MTLFDDKIIKVLSISIFVFLQIKFTFAGMTEKKILLVGECVLDIIQEVERFPGEDDDIRYFGFDQFKAHKSFFRY